MSYIVFNAQGGGTPGSDLRTLTGDTGGAISGDASYNINLVGTGGVTVAGSGNTLTISSTPSSTLDYTAVNSSPYVVGASDVYLGVDCSGGAITIQLPNAPTTGQYYIIKDSTGSAAANNITVTTVGGTVNIDGATTFVMNSDYQAVNLIFSGTSYEIY